MIVETTDTQNPIPQLDEHGFLLLLQLLLLMRSPVSEWIPPASPNLTGSAHPGLNQSTYPGRPFVCLAPPLTYNGQ